MRTLIECLSEMESAVRRVEDCIAEAKAIMAEMRQPYSDNTPVSEPLDINIEDVVELGKAAFIEEEVIASESEVELEPKTEPVQEPEPELEEPEPEFEPDLSSIFNQETENEPVRDLLQDESETKPLIMDRPGPGQKTSVLDAAGKKNSWRFDIPGAPVKNILSAISLNDRVLFINNLFRKDALLFQSIVNRVNNMTDFDEAEQYLTSMFPEWKLDSEVVYRFMMAIRRRFN